VNDTTAGGQAAHAFRTAMERLVAVVPGSLHEIAPKGTLLAFTGSQIPLLNTVMSVSSTPFAAEIALLADKSVGYPTKVPWTIRLRGEPDEEIVRIAETQGLKSQSLQPFMLRPLTVAPEQNGPTVVRRIPGGEYETFADTLAAAFGAPAFIISSLYTPSVLDAPEISAYVAEVDGIAVAAGLGVVTDGHVGLINIGTRPGYRRRGYGHQVTETILRDGYAAGARAAYLHANDEVEELFKGMGFQTDEQWTLFI
jgi:ribosomal protein S18 acetylase RimI-like enzyme